MKIYNLTKIYILTLIFTVCSIKTELSAGVVANLEELVFGFI
jgi:hypothetical protein